MRLTGTAIVSELAHALNADLMLPSVGAAVGIDPERTQGAQCSARMLNRKPGNRCTIRYVLELRDPTGSSRQISVIGKHFSKAKSAQKAYRRLQELRERVGGNVEVGVIPAPLSLLPELGIVLQEFCPGAELGSTLCMGSAQKPLSLAGQWLAGLHGTPPLPGLKLKSIDHELRKVDRRLHELGLNVPSGDRSRLHHVRDILHRLAGEFPDSPPAMIHRDFYHGNLMWDGEQVGILDFDQLAIGDPAMDVGHFLAHLTCLAFRETGRTDAFAAGAQSFVHSYFAKTSAKFGPRLAFFTGYTFIKLAHQMGQRKPVGWRRLAGKFIDLACAEGDLALREMSR